MTVEAWSGPVWFRCRRGEDVWLLVGVNEPVAVVKTAANANTTPNKRRTLGLFLLLLVAVFVIAGGCRYCGSGDCCCMVGVVVVSVLHIIMDQVCVWDWAYRSEGSLFVRRRAVLEVVFLAG
jgi:hypothetical protein